MRLARTRTDLEARLADWSTYIAEENGDLAPEQWATIDNLLDQYAEVLKHPPYTPLDPEFAPR